jgi:tRNA pseudouridine32 synthase/23S rRNA pseudouridine746 synthase
MAEHAPVRGDRRAATVAQLSMGGRGEHRRQREEDRKRTHRALWPRRAATGKSAAMLGEHVLFLDGEALVIDKPAGLPVDPPRAGGISLENHLSSLTFGFRRWPVAVHRLDRDTSGCLLLSRNPKAHARFQQAFERGEVAKRYVAILDRVPQEQGGTVDLPLAKVSSAERGWRMTGDPRGKAARTTWRVLAEHDGRALVEFRPETGRTHQIRVHALEGVGAPVTGDPVYGAAHPGGMMLHAIALSLARDGKPDIIADAPWPQRFAALGFEPA